MSEAVTNDLISAFAYLTLIVLLIVTPKYEISRTSFCSAVPFVGSTTSFLLSTVTVTPGKSDVNVLLLCSCERVSGKSDVSMCEVICAPKSESRGVVCPRTPPVASVVDNVLTLPDVVPPI